MTYVKKKWYSRIVFIMEMTIIRCIRIILILHYLWILYYSWIYYWHNWKYKTFGAPLAGRRQLATVRTRGQVSAWLGRRPQPQQQRSPSWFPDSAELRKLVWTGERVRQRSWQLLGTAKATQLLREALFWAFFFDQEEIQKQDICAPSL